MVRFPKGPPPDDIEAVDKAGGCDVLVRNGTRTSSSSRSGRWRPPRSTWPSGWSPRASASPSSTRAGSSPSTPPSSSSPRDHRLVVSLEDNGGVGGCGAVCSRRSTTPACTTPFRLHGIPQEFLDHAKRGAILERIGLDPQAPRPRHRRGHHRPRRRVPSRCRPRALTEPTRRCARDLGAALARPACRRPRRTGCTGSRRATDAAGTGSRLPAVASQRRSTGARPPRPRVRGRRLPAFGARPWPGTTGGRGRRLRGLADCRSRPRRTRRADRPGRRGHGVTRVAPSCWTGSTGSTRAGRGQHVRELDTARHGCGCCATGRAVPGRARPVDPGRRAGPEGAACWSSSRRSSAGGRLRGCRRRRGRRRAATCRTWRAVVVVYALSRPDAPRDGFRPEDVERLGGIRARSTAARRGWHPVRAQPRSAGQTGEVRPTWSATSSPTSRSGARPTACRLWSSRASPSGSRCGRLAPSEDRRRPAALATPRTATGHRPARRPVFNDEDSRTRTGCPGGRCDTSRLLRRAAPWPARRGGRRSARTATGTSRGCCARPRRRPPDELAGLAGELTADTFETPGDRPPGFAMYRRRTS